MKELWHICGGKGFICQTGQVLFPGGVLSGACDSAPEVESNYKGCSTHMQLYDIANYCISIRSIMVGTENVQLGVTEIERANEGPSG